MEERSISEYFYERAGREGHRCGYCKSSDTSISHGMWTHHLTVEDYQDLIDRGWRRSGKYCYKPLMSSTCCPAYTISCNATKFRISKSQKRCANAMKTYLALGEGPSSSSDHQEAKAAGASEGVAMSEKVEIASKKKKSVRPGEGADPSKPPCQKAKVLRMERKAKRAETVGDTEADTATGGERSSRNNQHAELRKPDEEGGSVQKDSIPEFLKEGKDGKKPVEFFLQLPDSPTTSHAHKLEITLVKSSPPSKEFNDTFAETYGLFKKYQMFVHREKEEDCKESNYRRFLCDSPIIPKKGQNGWPCDYGSYHQQYRIDGKLVAVGVIDVLPKCVSSVYVFFDMDYSFLNLGIYSALREIEMTRKLHLGDPETFKYYYMGYYIHSCQKMRYKGNYYPSYLLCPESYIFMPIETCLPKLDRTKYSRLCDHDTPSENVQDWLGQTKVLARRTVFTYSILSSLMSKAQKEEEKVKEYSTLVGPKVAGRMLLYLNL